MGERKDLKNLADALGDFWGDDEPDPPGDHPNPDSAAGTWVGPYYLIAVLGRGGMGVVYLAEQREPIRRRVALKIVKEGMDTKEVLARFEAERQALALMEHPNIARVLDAGTTASGKPYFVMELVTGLPISEFCDQRKLGLTERLELFAAVCHGIQHAHQKGVIHRDIKPSNVLVSMREDVPVPKVIDFGIAKATGQGLTEQTLFTVAGQLFGTLQYMSPEQLEFSGADVDTRSDIYSLGILLYELIAGLPPIGSPGENPKGLEDMLRQIRQSNVPRPSAKLKAVDAGVAADIAERRSTSLMKLVQSVSGDLDWIVLRALAKERTRRYETANALAMDVRRYLHNEPVTACPPTVGYLATKYVRRHRVPLAAGAAVALALATGLVISITQAFRATEAERLAGARLVEVERQRREALKAKEDSDALYRELSAQVELRETSEAGRRSAEATARSERERVDDISEFLRSEEIRKELLRSSPDGLRIIQAIDAKISGLFEGSDRSFAAEDFSLSLELGSLAMASLDLDWDSARNSYTKALGLLANLERTENAADYVHENVMLRVRLAEIARLEGRLRACLEELEAAGALSTGQDTADPDLLQQAMATADIQQGLALEQMGMEHDAAQKAASARARLESLPLGLQETGEWYADLIECACLATRVGGKLESTRTPDAPNGLQSAIALAPDANASGLGGPELEPHYCKAVLALAEFHLERDGTDHALHASLTVPVVASRPPGGAGAGGGAPGRTIGFDTALARIEELAVEHSNSREQQLELLRARLLAGRIYREAGDDFEALRYLEGCRALAARLAQQDEDIAIPVDYLIRTSESLADLYEQAGESGKQLEALQLCYDSLITAQRRGMDFEHYEPQFARLPEQMVEALIRRFYVVSGSRGTLEEIAFYADVVDYLGTEAADRRRITEEQNRWREKYRMRYYEVAELEPVTKTDGGVYQAVAHVLWWLGTKSGSIKVNKPDGGGSYEFGLAFDDENRLRIEKLGYLGRFSVAPKEPER